MRKKAKVYPVFKVDFLKIAIHYRFVTKTICYSINPNKYFEAVLFIFKQQKCKNVIYITTNKPYDSLVHLFDINGINTKNFFFIDCISLQLGRRMEDEPNNCLFLESPENLCKLSVTTKELIKHFRGEKLVFLDSLSTLRVYNDPEVLAKFISNFMLNKVNGLHVDSVILALESDVDLETKELVEKFADEVKKYGNQL